MIYKTIVAGAFLLGASHAYVLPPAGGVAAQQQQSSPMMAVTRPSASRRHAANNEQVDLEKMYQPGEAVALMKKLATAKFAETAELHGNLNPDPKFNDQQIRTTVSLPHGTGNDVRVAVLAEGAAADAAT